LAARLNLLGLGERRVHQYLSRLIDVAVEGEASAELRAGLDDPVVYRYWLGRVVADWLGAEAQNQPLWLDVEDLHWGDWTSISLLGDLLESNGELPILLTATARPSLDDRFAQLWASLEPQRLVLKPLSKRAARDLVAEAHPDLDADQVAAIIQRAEGNALFLEELVRMVAAGREELPQTVLAVVQSRIEQLGAEERRAVRAASVFGEDFWTGGVARLVGEGGERLDGLFDSLVGEEVVVRRRSSRYDGQQQWRFRHALLRDAAYAMLPDGERPGAHRRAALWLTEVAGEAAPALLAEHWERARERDKAKALFHEAATQALLGGDVDAVQRHAERGLALTEEPLARAHLEHLQCAAATYGGDYGPILRHAKDHLSVFERGSSGWLMTIAGLCFAGATASRPDALMLAMKAFGDPRAELEPSSYAATVLGALYIANLYMVGQAAAAPYREGLRRMAAAAPDNALVIRAWEHGVEGNHAVNTAEDWGTAFVRLSASADLFERCGDFTSHSMTLAWATGLSGRLGLASVVSAHAARLMELGRTGGLHYGESYGRLARAVIAGPADMAPMDALVEDLAGQSNIIFIIEIYTTTANFYLQLGQLDAVAGLAQRLSNVPGVRARSARAGLEAAVLLGEGRLGEAREKLQRAEAQQASGNRAPMSQVLCRVLAMRLAVAEGDLSAARDAATAAETWVTGILERLPPRLRDEARRGGVLFALLLEEARHILAR